MRFDFWTFSFQAINFIVLLFILKGLLYKPVREILEKRREISRKMLEDAEMARDEALRMKKVQEREMKNLQVMKADLIEQSRSEAEVERKKLLLDAQGSAKDIIEKERALFEAEKKRAGEETENRSVKIVTSMACSLLKDISSEALNKSIWQNLISEAGTIAKGISEAHGPSASSIDLVVRTAWPIGEAELEKFRRTLQSMVPRTSLSAREIADKDLIAGVSIKAGDKVYDFSMAGQIEAFASKLKTGRTISDGPMPDGR